MQQFDYTPPSLRWISFRCEDCWTRVFRPQGHTERTTYLCFPCEGARNRVSAGYAPTLENPGTPDLERDAIAFALLQGVL